MPQLVVYMKVIVQNKDCRSIENNRFKMRHAPCSNRCVPLVKVNSIAIIYMFMHII